MVLFCSIAFEPQRSLSLSVRLMTRIVYIRSVDLWTSSNDLSCKVDTIKDWFSSCFNQLTRVPDWLETLFLRHTRNLPEFINAGLTLKCVILVSNSQALFFTLDAQKGTLWLSKFSYRTKFNMATTNRTVVVPSAGHDTAQIMTQLSSWHSSFNTLWRS